MYKIKIVQCCTAGISNMEDVANLVASVVQEAEENGQYVTFSKTGDEVPMFPDEIIITLSDEDKIRAPKSAGGDWAEFDEALQARR